MAEDDDFASLFEQSLSTATPRRKRLQRGESVQGQIVAIGDEWIFVDVGTKAEARIARSSVEDDDGALKVALGDPIRATVADARGSEGAVLVVAFGRQGMDAETLSLAAENGTPVEGTFTKAVKAGIEVEIGGKRAFCPASQVEVGYTSDLEPFVGQTYFFKVLEVKDGGRSIVVSRKAILQEERDQKARDLAERLEPGAELDGIVQTIQPYGAFVDLGGIQGLVHVSELAHGRVSSPDDVVSVGETVRVKVLSVETATSGKARDAKISLSMKALVQPDTPDLQVDQVIEGTVAKVESYGVVVDTEAGRGLIPNRELGLHANADPRRAFPKGTAVQVVLTNKDSSGKLRFSIQAVAAAEERRNYREFSKGDRTGQLGSLGDLLRSKMGGD